MADQDQGPLIDATWTALDAVMYAQELAVQKGRTDTLGSLALAREWIRITLRRLGVDTVPHDL